MSTERPLLHLQTDDGMESIFHRILAHTLRGELDRQTILHGLAYVRKWLRSRGLLDCSFSQTATIQNFSDQEGFTKTAYVLVDNKTKKQRTNPESITALDLPKSAQLVMINERITCDLLQHFVHQLDDPDFLGTIVGPSTNGADPNNGYFNRMYREADALVPFQDTNPSGQRRGTIAMREDGKTVLLTDGQKWEAVRSDFKGYFMIAGTSFYFTSEDIGIEEQLRESVDRSVVSYLIQFIDGSGGERMSFLNIDALLPRFMAFQLIKQHMESHKATHFIAVELDYLGGGCMLANDKTRTHHKQHPNNPGELQKGIDTIGLPYARRRDYYDIRKGKLV